MTHYPVPIPEDLLDERVLPIQVVAQLLSQHPKKTLAMAKEGRFGPLLRVGDRWYGLRWRDVRRAISESEVSP